MSSFRGQDDALGARVDVDRAQVGPIQRIPVHHENAGKVFQRFPFALNVVQVAEQDDRPKLLKGEGAREGGRVWVEGEQDRGADQKE